VNSEFSYFWRNDRNSSLKLTYSSILNSVELLKCKVCLCYSAASHGPPHEHTARGEVLHTTHVNT
jgi:hypothetical protein